MGYSRNFFRREGPDGQPASWTFDQGGSLECAPSRRPDELAALARRAGQAGEAFTLPTDLPDEATTTDLILGPRCRPVKVAGRQPPQGPARGPLLQGSPALLHAAGWLALEA